MMQELPSGPPACPNSTRREGVIGSDCRMIRPKSQ